MKFRQHVGFIMAAVAPVGHLPVFADTSYTDTARTYSVTVPDGWMKISTSVQQTDAVFGQNETSPVPLVAFESIAYSDSLFALPENTLDTVFSDPFFHTLLQDEANSIFADVVGASDTETVITAIDSTEHEFSAANFTHTVTFNASLGDELDDVTFYIVDIKGADVTEQVLQITYIVPKSTRRQYESDLESIIESVRILSPQVQLIASTYWDPERHYSVQVPAEWKVEPSFSDTDTTFARRDGATVPRMNLIENSSQDSIFSAPLLQELINGDITINDQTFVEFLTETLNLGELEFSGEGSLEGFTLSDFELTDVVMNDAGTKVTFDMQYTASLLGEIHVRIIELKGNYESLQFELASLEQSFAADSAVLDTMVDSVQFFDVPQFGDVYVDNPHATAIHQLRIYGITDGYDGINFGPDLYLHRAELLKMALEGIGVDVTGYANIQNPYTDLPADHTLLPYVLYAYYNDIARGYGDSTFGPDTTATHAEAVKMILNIMGYGVLQPPEGVTYNLPSEGDLSGYVHRAMTMNILYDSSHFQSNTPIQRDYTAETLYRLLVIRGGTLQSYPDSAAYSSYSKEYADDALPRCLPQLANEYTSDHFIIHYSDNIYPDAYAQFLEGFATYVNGEYGPFQYDYPLHVCMFDSEHDFKLHTNTVFEDDSGLLGYYNPDDKTIYTFHGTGLGTLAHEVMHPLLGETIPIMESWADEGIPAFFEKLFGYFDEQGTLHLVDGFQNPWRVEEVLTLADLNNVSLRDIVTGKHASDFQSLARLVAVFMDNHGVLPKYLQLLRDADKGNYDTYVEAAFGRPLSELEPLWDEYTDAIIMHADEISTIPSSKIFDSFAAYQDFANQTHLETLGQY